MRCVLVVPVLVALVLPSFAPLCAQRTDDEIRRLEQAWALASRQNDTAAFNRLLAPDYRGVLVDGTTETRDDRLRAFGSGVWRTVSLELSDIQVRSGSDLAAVSGLARRSEVLDGHPQEFQFFYTRVWRRRGDRWQVIQFQSTPVAPSAARRHGAQAAPNIVGTWRLVSFVAADSNGKYRPVWGEHPSGLIVYTADGHVAAQLYDPSRARIGPLASASPLALTQPSFVGLRTYFGTYQLDTTAHTVSHHVEGAMAPDWVGSTLVRGYRFVSPDTIELRALTNAAGKPAAGQAIVVWQRVRT